MKKFVLKHENVEYQGYFAEAGKPKASIAVLHGIGEHFGRYERFAHYMAEHGCSVYGIDLPGHGKSPGIRGQIGKREDFYNLVDELASYVKNEVPGVPMFLMGHSMGGNLALSYRLARKETHFKAFIISSPWIKLAGAPSLLAHFISLIAALVAPNLTIDNRIKADKLFTPSDEVSDEAKPDNLCHPFITPRTAADCFKWARIILKNAAVERRPVYLMHGSADSICSVEGSREFAAAAGDMCTYREWEGLKHELLNEVWKDVANEILVWIEMQI